MTETAMLVSNPYEGERRPGAPPIASPAALRDRALRFADWVGDLHLNASYIVINNGGRFIVGTADEPFPYWYIGQ